MRCVAGPAAVGAAAVAAYLAVVAATTPALAADAAIWAAVQANHVVVAAIGAAVGLQSHMACRARHAGTCTAGRGGRRRHHGANAAGATATSFFSFFSLVPLGCCGWWLYVLSLLPSVAGVGATAVLIEHSQLLAYAGAASMLCLCGLSAYRMRRLLWGPGSRSRITGPRGA